MAATALNPGEEAQLQQTIEMFEVIVQSQPQDMPVAGDPQGGLLKARVARRT